MKGLGVVLGVLIFMLLVKFNVPGVQSEPIKNVELIPVVIKIPRLKIAEDIVPGLITKNDWQINEKKVNYLVGSGSVIEGNLVLYAHNKFGLFSGLNKLKAGDELELMTGGGVYKYIVSDSKQVKSDDVSILSNSDIHKLTLFTCDGPFDIKRWVVVADSQNSGV